MAPVGQKSGSKSLSPAANLANLLPTGTVLSFQALVPSFSNKGSCLAANKYLTVGIIIICSVVCFLSSFTDSFTDDNGKLHYGIATTKGLYVFDKDEHHKNKSDEKDNNKEESDEEKATPNKQASDDMEAYRIRTKDFVHAFSSLMVFLVFAISNSDVQRCFFRHAGANENTLIMNLPLAIGALASGLFMIFPTARRGIGFADSSTPQRDQTCPK